MTIYKYMYWIEGATVEMDCSLGAAIQSHGMWQVTADVTSLVPLIHFVINHLQSLSIIR